MYCSHPAYFRLLVQTALHQTSKELRPDGSISQSDISALLTSKFGIAISEEEVKHVILKGLSVCDDASYFDLCEVVAALIIPELIKAAKCSDDGDGASADDLAQDNMFGIVLESIARTSTSLHLDSNEDVVLNTENVKQILLSLGEDKIAKNDDLIHEMTRQAVGRDDDGGSKILNASAFARALTSDVQTYQNEDISLSDICRSEKQNTISRLLHRPTQVSAIDNESEAIEEEEKEDVSDVEDGEAKGGKEDTTSVNKDSLREKSAYQTKRVFTAPSIDYTNDGQALRSVSVGLWLFLLSHILASGFFGMQDFPSLVPSEVCPSNDRTVGCDVAEVILSWIDSVLTILLVGGICIMCIGSLGNRVGASRITVSISLLPVLYFFIKPFTSIGTEPGDFSGEYHRQFALGLSMAIAVVIVLERMRQILFLSDMSKRLLGHCSSTLTQLCCCGIRKTVIRHSVESASSYKVNRMLNNAVGITISAKSIQHQSAIAVFYESNDELEKVGGHIWVWNRIKNRELYLNEGIRFSARLLAANIMQYFIIVCKWLMFCSFAWLYIFFSLSISYR